MVAELEISRFVGKKQQLKGFEKHLEETFYFQKDFSAKVNKPKYTISELVNSFDKESADLYRLDTRRSNGQLFDCDNESH